MFEVSVKARFSAAHRLRRYPGSCARVHGHNWDVTVVLRGERLDRLGMLVDFREVKRGVKKALDRLDHADLNALPAFGRANPTSENLSRHLFEVLTRVFRAKGCRVARVTVAETPEAAATYEPDEGPARPEPSCPRPLTSSKRSPRSRANRPGRA